MTRHGDAAMFADVLAHFADDGTRNLFRRLLEQALQGLIHAKATAYVGASRHERTESRSNWRNGNRQRACRRRRVMSSWGSRNCVPGRSSRRFSNLAAGLIRPCGR